ncbi:hypothetical protein J3R82DRAFT_10268 [Butyriboletus roseoflavus]|nr:hypothetical protein J3R82DRAFT_10268 [Butyriboletus roseoflavus]
MGKNKGKNKDEIPNPTSVTNRDILQRLNFLYQASVLLNGLEPPDSIHRDANDPSRSSTTPNDNDTSSEHQDSPARPTTSQRKKRRRVVRFEELSRSYVETMKSVGRKTNVKIDPSVKRRICKRCCAPLVPGISATVRCQRLGLAWTPHLVSMSWLSNRASHPCSPYFTRGFIDGRGHDGSPIC